MPVLYKPFQSMLEDKKSGKKLFYPRVVRSGNVYAKISWFPAPVVRSLVKVVMKAVEKRRTQPYNRSRTQF